MFGRWKRSIRKYKRGESRNFEIQPDEVLIDARNLPEFDTTAFEGRMEYPIEKNTLFSIIVVFLVIISLFTSRLFVLQVERGEAYSEKSENNLLHQQLIFAERGLVVDRNGAPLIWNEPSITNDFPKRKYIEEAGFGHLLGYVSSPKKDSAGFYYQNYFEGKDGVESIFNETLSGENGLKLTETNAMGDIESESSVKLPQSGTKLTLSVDAKVQEIFNKHIKEIANKVNFTGGAGILMDIETGEIIALTNYPEYSGEAISNGDSKVIQELNNDQRKPFLNRAAAGAYTPGSIVKPFLAAGALAENLIDPEKEIYVTGKIEIPNPYNPEEKTVFPDWKAHGYVDMRRAIAVSSNVYFYEVGGGFENQKGLGITNIEKYLRMFGFGNLTGTEFVSEQPGTIPNPSWKEENFPGDPWRLGDTYHTAIGQYGVQVTPIQVVRAVAALANNGKLLKPTLEKIDDSNRSKISSESLPLSPSYLQIVREGMRLGAQEGTAVALNTPAVKIAAKTGTAELGLTKAYVNSWAIGFFPYDKPKYAFTVLMERGPRANLVGAAVTMRGIIDEMVQETPEYFKE